MSLNIAKKAAGTAVVIGLTFATGAQAQTLSSAQCTGPTVVATFSASVAQATGQTSAAVEGFTGGLTALKFKNRSAIIGCCGAGRL